MRKKFINDSFSIGLWLILCSLCVLMLILPFVFAKTHPNSLTVRIVFSIMWGLPTILCIVAILLKTELIDVNVNQIESKKFLRGKTVLLLSEVVEIREIKMPDCMNGSPCDAWEFLDARGKTISIYKSKRRGKLISFIKSQATFKADNIGNDVF